MIRRHAVFLIGFLILLGGVSSLPSLSFADSSTTSNNSIRISPGLTDLQLSAGETSTTVVATVTNLTNAPLVVDLSTKDFSANLAHAGAISFYGAGYNPSTNPHSLQAAISFSQNQITLRPKESQKVAIILNGVDKLAAGGHYGAVLFSPESLAAKADHIKVSVHTAVASLIFLKTSSGGTQSLKLLPFSVSSLRFNLPSNTFVAFTNNGNTQTAPIGQLTLYSPNGNIAATSVINPGAGLILPGTSRLFAVGLPLPGMRFARPGVYKMVLQYRTASSDSFITVTRSFYYINLYIFLPVVILFAVIIWILRWHHRKVLRVAKRTSRSAAQRARNLRSRQKIKKVYEDELPVEKKPKQRKKRVSS